MSDYQYIVQFEAPGDPGSADGEMGHTARTAHDDAHDAIRQMRNLMAENPDTKYRLDVYDRDRGERVAKGRSRTFRQRQSFRVAGVTVFEGEYATLRGLSGVHSDDYSLMVGPLYVEFSAVQAQDSVLMLFADPDGHYVSVSHDTHHEDITEEMKAVLLGLQ